MPDSHLASVVIVLLLIAGAAMLLKTIGTAGANRIRILDILVIGALMWVAPYIHEKGPIWVQNVHELHLAGFLVGLYGWLILVYQKFLDGYNSSGK